MAKDFTPSSRNREAFEAMTDTVGNVPPQAVELEEAVLGALMLEKDCIITVQEFVSPEAFYTEEHRLIYKAINELSMELKPIDLYTVTERLKAKKELKKVGGASYLAQLTQKVGSAANVEFHAKIIAQKYGRSPDKGSFLHKGSNRLTFTGTFRFDLDNTLSLL